MRSHLLPVLGLALAFGGLVGCQDDDGSSGPFGDPTEGGSTDVSDGASDTADEGADDDEVAADDEPAADEDGGDGEAVLLRVTDGAEVGQHVEQSMTMSLESDGGAPSLDVAVQFVGNNEIVEVADDGGYTLESTIVSLENIDDSGGGAQIVEMMEPLVGVTMRQTMSAEGEPGGLEIVGEPDATAEALLAQFGTSISGTPLAFPDEPVAVGDEWSNDANVGASGMDLEVSYEYRLVELTDETFTVEVRYDTEIDEAGVEGSTSGEGTMTGVIGQPLLLDASMSSTTSVASGSASLDQTITVESDSEPVAD